MKGLVGGPLLVGGLGPGPPAPPLKSGPGATFDDFEVHLKVIQPRLSCPRPFQLSLASFRVARSPSNS